MTAGTATARLKQLRHGRWRAFCGRTGRDCPGLLGYLERLPESDRRDDPARRDWTDEEEARWVEQDRSGRMTLDVFIQAVTPAVPLGAGPPHPATHGDDPSGAGWPAPSPWVITHPAGLRPLGDGYAVIKGKAAADGRRVGRRPVPPWVHLDPRSGRGLSRSLLLRSGRHGIFGAMPSLPATVTCPTCGLRNRVDPPPSRPA